MGFIRKIGGTPRLTVNGSRCRRTRSSPATHLTGKRSSSWPPMSSFVSCGPRAAYDARTRRGRRRAPGAVTRPCGYAVYVDFDYGLIPTWPQPDRIVPGYAPDGQAYLFVLDFVPDMEAPSGYKII